MSFQWTTDDQNVTADSGNYTASGSYTPQFPNVPNLPGVPLLKRMQVTPPLIPLSSAGSGHGSAESLAAIATASLLPGGSIGSIGAAEAVASAMGLKGIVAFGNRLYAGIELDSLTAGPLPQYSIVNANSQASKLVPDSVIEVDFDADSDMMTHPIEEGGFAAYNRMQNPKRIRLLLACRGQNMSRAAFLSTLESLKNGTDLSTIATPDAAYSNMGLKNYGYRKSAERGAITIWADTVWLEGLSSTVTITDVGAAQPQGAATSNLGAIQPQTPSSSQVAAVSAPPTVPSPLPGGVTITATRLPGAPPPGIPAPLIEVMPASGYAF
jgi:hypothetical protein